MRRVSLGFSGRPRVSAFQRVSVGFDQQASDTGHASEDALCRRVVRNAPSPHLPRRSHAPLSLWRRVPEVVGVARHVCLRAFGVPSSRMHPCRRVSSSARRSTSPPPCIPPCIALQHRPSRQPRGFPPQGRCVHNGNLRKYTTYQWHQQTRPRTHPRHSNGNSHMALGDRRSEMTTAGSALGCARGGHPRLGLAVRCSDLTL